MEKETRRQLGWDFEEKLWDRQKTKFPLKCSYKNTEERWSCKHPIGQNDLKNLLGAETYQRALAWSFDTHIAQNNQTVMRCMTPGCPQVSGQPKCVCYSPVNLDKMKNIIHKFIKASLCHNSSVHFLHTPMTSSFGRSSKRLTRSRLTVITASHPTAETVTLLGTRASHVKSE